MSDGRSACAKYAAVPGATPAGTAIGTSATQRSRGHFHLNSRRDGYLLVSDQQANQFRIYRREGEPGRPHEHPLIKTVAVSAIASDGSEVTSTALGPKFPHGLFVAMSNGKVFHYYSWDDIAGQDLKRAPNGVAP